MGRLAIWVRPGSATDRVAWDPWRKRWVISCRAPAIEQAANRSMLNLVAHWLDIPRDRVRWAKAGRSPAKVLEVDGLTDSELSTRLARAAADPNGPA